jgi:3D (Asp-Asp-Asp) domain-containing protein
MDVRRKSRATAWSRFALVGAILLIPRGSLASGDVSMTPLPPGHRELNGPVLVEATAYNSVAAQTEGDPEIGAWGDRLDPGIKSVAVSEDLLQLGMRRGARVRIEGLPGVFLVLDRMPPQWQRRIDIHMGESVDAAKQWGRREVRIYWQAP